jgi:hypothetical protein
VPFQTPTLLCSEVKFDAVDGPPTNQPEGSRRKQHGGAAAAAGGNDTPELPAGAGGQARPPPARLPPQHCREGHAHRPPVPRPPRRYKGETSTLKRDYVTNRIFF